MRIHSMPGISDRARRSSARPYLKARKQLRPSDRLQRAAESACQHAPSHFPSRAAISLQASRSGFARTRPSGPSRTGSCPPRSGSAPGPRTPRASAPRQGRRPTAAAERRRSGAERSADGSAAAATGRVEGDRGGLPPLFAVAVALHSQFVVQFRVFRALLRNFPRKPGMAQKVHLWSQPSATRM